jgi:hypothetical protein
MIGDWEKDFTGRAHPSSNRPEPTGQTAAAHGRRPCACLDHRAASAHNTVVPTVHVATPMCTGSHALIPCRSPQQRKEIFSPPRALAHALLHRVLPLYLLLPLLASRAASP